MERGGCVYIMTNQRNGTLYIGVTSRLIERVQEHKTRIHTQSFTSKYGCTMLVYYNVFSSIEEAIAEEKRIKAGSRSKKLKLIEQINPEWKDLWNEIKEW
ncbi:GIY-YIG nuclease family protein [Dysgonomonas reticulitermitis]